MDTPQADSVSHAILGPSVKEQSDDRAKIEAKALRAASHRRQALYFTAGYLLGTAIGYFASGRIAAYGIAGGFVGLLIGGLFARRLPPTAG